MHRLFEQVLEKKDLSKAGDLFSLEDSVIVDELSEVLKTIQVLKFLYKKCSSTLMISGYFQQAGVSDQPQQPVSGGDLRDQSNISHQRDWLHPTTC